MSTGLKLFIQLMCFLGVLALFGPFILKAPDGQPFLNFRDVLPDMFFKVPSLPNKNSISNTFGEHAGETKIYRWATDDGHMQFSNIEPKNTEYETLWVDPDANLVQGLAVNSQTPHQDSQESTINPLPMLSISPEQLKQLQKDANNIKKLTEDRYKALESL